MCRARMMLAKDETRAAGHLKCRVVVARNRRPCHRRSRTRCRRASRGNCDFFHPPREFLQRDGNFVGRIGAQVGHRIVENFPTEPLELIGFREIDAILDGGSHRVDRRTTKPSDEREPPDRWQRLSSAARHDPCRPSTAGRGSPCTRRCPRQSVPGISAPQNS